jgi:predicted regulator of Ras-like GTPase activity (Roadblock/LC7/MglB family)
MSTVSTTAMSFDSTSARLARVLHGLLAQAPEVEAAAVVSFDGLPMASALPPGMDEDRVAAMSAALLSLGERAAEGLGRGGLSQVYVEGDAGTVFLVSADDEAVLVAVAAQGAKAGLMLFEVRRAAESVADALRDWDAPVDEPMYAEAVAEAAPATTAVYVPAPADLAPTTMSDVEGVPAAPEPAAEQFPEIPAAMPTAQAWSPYPPAPQPAPWS